MKDLTIEKSVLISAGLNRTWEVLTVPEQMLRWMGDPEMNLEILVHWEVGAPFIIRGVHHVPFENRGYVLAVEINRRLRYSQMSSLSRLKEKDSNYSRFEFLLAPEEAGTRLTLAISGFPTDTIYKHLAFYWGTTIHKIKALAESKTLLY